MLRLLHNHSVVRISEHSPPNLLPLSPLNRRSTPCCSVQKWCIKFTLSVTASVPNPKAALLMHIRNASTVYYSTCCFLKKQQHLQSSQDCLCSSIVYSISLYDFFSFPCSWDVSRSFSGTSTPQDDIIAFAKITKEMAIGFIGINYATVRPLNGQLETEAAGGGRIGGCRQREGVVV